MNRRGPLPMLACLVALATLPALALDLGPPTPLEPAAVKGVPGGATYAVRGAAWDGGALLVWEDGRTGALLDVYATRVSRLGAPLDPGGLRLGAAPGHDIEPDVACGTQSCLAVWRQDPDDIVACPVAFDGTLPAAPFSLLTSTPYKVSGPSVVFDGTRYVAAWAEDQHVALRELTDAPVPVPSGTTVTTAAGASYTEATRLAWDGTAVLVVWMDEPHTSFARYAAGAVGAVQVLAANSKFPTVGVEPSGFLAAWERTNATIYGSRVYAQGVSSLGALQGSAQAVSPPAEAGFTPVVSRAPSATVVSWLGPWAILASRKSGAAFSPPEYAQQVGHSWSGSHAWVWYPDGSGLLAWADHRFADEKQLHGGLVWEDGGVLDGGPLQRSDDTQLRVHATWTGNGFLTVFQDQRGGKYDVRTRALDPRGVPLGPPLEAWSGPERETLPAVLFDGQRVVVAFATEDAAEEHRFLVTRLAPDGTRGDAGVAEVGVGTGYFTESPSLAMVGQDVLVVFAGYQNCCGRQVFGVRVRPDGTLADPTDRKLFPGSTDSWAPSVAVAGGQVLIAWADQRAQQMRVGRLTTGLVPLDDGGVVLESSGTQAVWTGVASDGAGWLVVWERWGNGLRAVLITAQGAVGAPFELVPSSMGPFNRITAHMAPSVAWDGTSYVVAWARDDAVNGPDVVLTRISKAGVVSPATPLYATASHDLQASVAPGTPGRVVVGWSSYVEANDALRAYARVAAEVPEGKQCWANAECLLATCVQGVCCALDGGCVTDAGVPTDGGPAVTDGGSGGDGGATFDGGALGDAASGSAVDAGGGGAAPLRPLRVGCDCAAVDGATLAAAALLGVALRRRRRAP